MFTFCGVSDFTASNDKKGCSHSPVEVQLKHFAEYPGGKQEIPQFGPRFELSTCKTEVYGITAIHLCSVMFLSYLILLK
jgi:hypothetical protein